MKGLSYTIYSTDNHAGYTLVFVMITSSIPKHLTMTKRRSRCSTFTVHNTNTRPHQLVHMFKSASQCSVKHSPVGHCCRMLTQESKLKSAELSWLSLLRLGLDSVWYLQEWRLGILEFIKVHLQSSLVETPWVQIPPRSSVSGFDPTCSLGDQPLSSECSLQNDKYALTRQKQCQGLVRSFLKMVWSIYMYFLQHFLYFSTSYGYARLL